MDPAEGTASTEVGANRWFMLLHDEDGYTLWAIQSDADEPLGSYPDTDEGADEAWAAFEQRTSDARRARSAGWLAAVVVIAGIVWVLSTLVTGSVFAYAGFGRHDALMGFAQWVSAIEGGARVVFIVSLATYLVRWMELRRGRD